MAINDAPRRAGPFTGNGVTTVFPFEFKVLNGADLRVTVRKEGAIAFTDLDPSAYTVAGVGADEGGSVVLDAPLPDGDTLVILGDASYDQPLTLFNQGAYFAEDVMRALDRGVVLTQQLREQVGRAVLSPVDTETSEGFTEQLFTARDEAVASASAASTSEGNAAASAAQAAASAAQAADYPVPVGQTIVMPSVIPLPDGYIAAAGQSVNRNDAPKLFAAIGTEFGAGDGPGPTELLTNGDFTSGLDGWEVQTSGGAFVNANDRLEISGYVLLSQDFASEGAKILTVDVFALDDASTPLRFFGFNTSTEETVLVAEITAPGVYRFFFPAGFDQLFLSSFSPQGDPHQVSSVSLETGGTFAAPNPTAPAADTRWLIRKD